MNDRDHLSPLLQALADHAAWLKAENIRGAIIGGVAASILGRPRATVGVDAVVLLDITLLEAFLQAGSRFQFTPRLGDAVAFAQQNRVLLVRHEPSQTPVDITLAGLPFEEESIDRASTVSVAGVSFPIITPEDLIIMKAIAHRPRDMADIESVLDTHPYIDLERIRYWVSQFASVLEAPEILDDFERIVSRQH